MIPSCRQDQILIAGRLGDSCCTYYFCGEWISHQTSACTPLLHPSFLGGGEERLGVTGGVGTGEGEVPVQRDM